MRLIHVKDDYDIEMFIPETKILWILPVYNLEEPGDRAYVEIGMDTGDGDVCLTFKTLVRADEFISRLLANFEIRTVKLDPPTADIIKLGE